MAAKKMIDSNFQEFLSQTEEIIRKTGDKTEVMQQICQLLNAEVEVFDWVGFYLKDPEEDQMLKLGPYVGEPTEHTTIPYGKGICGQAAETEETFVVQDVSKATNYLSCSVHVQAEIVVPIMKDGEFVGELDIDSHTRNSISEQHKELCERICDKIAPLL